MAYWTLLELFHYIHKFRAQTLSLCDTPSPDQRECVGTCHTQHVMGPEGTTRPVQ